MSASRIQRDIEIAPKNVSLLDFVTFPVSDTKSIRNKWADLHSFGLPMGKGASIPYYTFGACDAIVLSCAKDLQSASEIRNRLLNSNRGPRLSNSLHLGVVTAVYPDSFSLTRAANKCPFLGCITVKMRDDAWENILSKVGRVETISNIATRLLRSAIMKSARECNLDASEYKAMLSLSFDAEDLTILLFSLSLSFIKRFATNLRTLETNDVVPNGGVKNRIKHIIAATNTVIGVSLARKWRRNDAFQNPNEYAAEERLCWNTFVQTRPGHMQCAVGKIKKARGCGNLACVPVVGRNDLSVCPKGRKSVSSKQFIDSHRDLVNALEGERSAVSTETIIGFPDLHKTESRHSPMGLTGGRKKERRVIRQILSQVQADKTLHEYECQAFSAILRKLLVLTEDWYMQDSYLSTAIAAVLGIGSYISLTANERLGRACDLDMWLTCIDLSHASRFAGNPPVGETAASPTLGQYMSGQKILTLFDNIANTAVASYEKLCRPKWFEFSWVTSMYSTGLSTTVIPFPTLKNYFIAVPYGIGMNPLVAMEFICHELGHVLFQCFLAGEEVQSMLWRPGGRSFSTQNESLLQYEEMLAELLCVRIISNNSFSKHRDILNKVITCMSGPRDKISRSLEAVKHAHLNGAKALTRGEFMVHAPGPIKRLVKQWADMIAGWEHPLIAQIRNATMSPYPAWDLWDLCALTKGTDYSSK